MRKYCIKFDTLDKPGRMEAVQVRLDKVFILPSDSVRVDLCDDPLYPALVEYVKNNPGPTRK